MGNVLKWGGILLAIYIAWRWIAVNSGAGGNIGSGSFSLLNAPYAAPLAGPYSGVVGWAAPWQYQQSGVSYGGRPRRFRR
jgi:hypothetical protein